MSSKSNTDDSNKKDSDGLYNVQFQDDPEAIYRICSVLAYMVVLFVIGLPIWWMTTRVYRASLPISEMYNVVLHDKEDKPYGMPLSLEYDVLITMVNPYPQNLKMELDGEVMEAALKPFLTTVSPIADFTVKSQWLYLVELGVIPKKMGDHYALNQDQLPHIITPLEKKLWSSMSPRPCINLVIYVSPCGAPLYIYDKNEAKLETNAFLSPRWGGVLILNPDSISCEDGVFKPNAHQIISTFITQLQQLLHVGGITSTDLHNFKIDKAVEMIDSTRRTLKSLAQLLSEINSIVISDDVAEKIQLALTFANTADALLKINYVDEALKAAKISFYHSEAAFSDPSLLALLYFPDDQKYAVYIPLFLPITIPVVMSVFIVKRLYSNIKNSKMKVE